MSDTPPDLDRWTPTAVRALRERFELTQEAFAPQLGYTSGRRVSELERNPRPESVSLTAQTARLLDHIDRSGLLPKALVEGHRGASV